MCAYVVSCPCFKLIPVYLLAWINTCFLFVLFQASGSHDDKSPGEELVGSKIKVWWPDDET